MAVPIPHWPGELDALRTGQVYVRRAPAHSSGSGMSPRSADSGASPQAVRSAAAAPRTPAVFVHGLGGSSTNWTDLMDLLAGQPAAGQSSVPLACEALDLPGFGFSPPPRDGDYSLDAHARSVIDLIETRAIWPVHLFGNSMGGAIATRVAARRPDLVRTLTLISPALPDLRPRLLPLRLSLVSLPVVGTWLMDRARQVPAAQRVEVTLRETYADPARMHPARVAEEIAEVERRDGLGYATAAFVCSARSLVTEYTRQGPAALWRDATRVTAPTLIIYGSHDRLVSPAMAGRAARAFRDSRVIVAHGIGHVAMMERPELVAKEFRDLVAGLAERPAHGLMRVSG
jgi:pimeloyl-ACP methyl ester carboxylesterase